MVVRSTDQRSEGHWLVSRDNAATNVQLQMRNLGEKGGRYILTDLGAHEAP